MYKIIQSMVIVGLLLSINISASEQQQLNEPIEVTVYKTPSCGCCKKWIDHIQQQGIVAQSQDLGDISKIKSWYGIQPKFRSCHTAVSKRGFAFEGHVPAKFIHKFLSESHPDAIGLTVPAMPVGSPGMEVGNRFTPYEILILYKDGSSKVYASISRYEEQFEWPI